MGLRGASFSGFFGYARPGHAQAPPCGRVVLSVVTSVVVKCGQEDPR